MPDRRYLSADLGGTHLRVGVRGAGDGLLAGETVPASADWGADDLAVRLAGFAEQHGPIAAAGVALTGDVDAAAGICRSMRRYPRLEGVNLVSFLQQCLGCPVNAANDGLCAALAELHAGAGRGVDDWVMVTLGTGVGGAVVLGGRLLLGAQGRVGKVGHQIIQAGGPVHCHCGLPGCWQSFVAKEGILARARSTAARYPASPLAERLTLPGASVREVWELAAQGDPAAAEVLEATGRCLGVGVANLVKILAPQRVIVGGGIAQDNPPLLAAAQRTLDEYAFEPWQRVPVVPAAFGQEAGLLGATFLAERGLE